MQTKGYYKPLAVWLWNDPFDKIPCFLLFWRLHQLEPSIFFSCIILLAENFQRIQLASVTTHQSQGFKRSKDAELTRRDFRCSDLSSFNDYSPSRSVASQIISEHRRWYIFGHIASAIQCKSVRRISAFSGALSHHWVGECGLRLPTQEWHNSCWVTKVWMASVAHCTWQMSPNAIR
jgi:hypothetical protein